MLGLFDNILRNGTERGVLGLSLNVLRNGFLPDGTLLCPEKYDSSNSPIRSSQCFWQNVLPLN